MNFKRRLVMSGGLGAGMLALTGTAGLLVPRPARAAWPQDAFDARNVAKALEALNGVSAVETGDLVLTVPELAENGGSVPVTVISHVPGTESITIFANKNFNPLVAVFSFGEGTEAYVETRIKMAESAEVTAVAKAKGKLYSTSKPVKVAVGGCAG